MCGICGIAPFDMTGSVDPARLKRMTDVMAHRGPDCGGFHREPGIGLGFRRLSIIDLETGNQPISNEAGTVYVLCNGEIYNYVELRRELEASGHLFRTHSDVEVIVHLYEEYGVEFLPHLRGMFAIAVWDGRTQSLILARDRFGIKPLHYALNTEALYFASEQKSILAAEEIRPQLDFEAVKGLFAYGFAPGKRTLCKGILRLRPGHYLVLRQGTATIHKYWDVHFPLRHSHPCRSEDDWAEALSEKLQESVRLHLRSDVPVGAWLSGGIDSSGIVSLMCRLSNRRVKTFSIAFENADFDEVTHQRTLAHFSGYNISNEQVLCRTSDFELLPKAIWYCEDLSTSGIEIPRMMLSELTSRNVRVVLTGEGSDEIFGAYGWFHADKFLRPLAALPLPLRRLMLLGPVIPRFRPIASRVHLAPAAMNIERYRAMIASPSPVPFHGLVTEEIRQTLEKAGEAEDLAAPPDEFNGWHPFNQLQYYEMKVRLPDYINRDLDLTSMAHSVEARVPFLDHELAELCAQIPPALKMKWLNEKYILRKALRPFLPEEILRRKKRGLLAPRDQWLRGKLPEFAREMLSESCIKKKGYFLPERVGRLIEMHRSHKADLGKYLMAVLVIQLWDEVFIRGCRE